MSAFKFDFAVDDDDDSFHSNFAEEKCNNAVVNANDPSIHHSPRRKENEGPINVPESSLNPMIRTAKEVEMERIALSKDCEQCTVVCGGTQLYYLCPEEVEKKLQDAREVDASDLRTAIETHSDLVPCIYEGGLKVWECSLDLVQYLHEENVMLADLKVLEIGCGAGLPGIYAMKKGARVHFQDYNEEVLVLMTIPNVLLNHDGKLSPERCQFWAGDWSLVQQLLDEEQQRFDVILTAETIYNIDSQLRLYDIMKKLIKPDGRIILAAKTHYFGVGGGTRQFEDFVRGRGEFEIKPCRVFTEGVQREILEMRLLPQKKNDAKS